MNYTGFRMGLVAAVAAAAAVAAPASAHNTPQELANKKVVLDFYSALNDADAAGTTAKQADSIIRKYIGPTYTQHSDMMKNLPGPGTDRDKLIRMFSSMPAMSPAPARPNTDAIMAEGDRVMMLTSRKMPNGKTSFIFNMFRVQNGQLVEHWDVSEPMGGAGAAPGGPAGGPPAGAPPMGAGGPPPGATPPAGAPPPGFTPPGAN